MEYEVIRSRRKTLTLEVRGERVIVKAPWLTPDRYIQNFVLSHERWISRRLAKNAAVQAEAADKLTEEDIRQLAKQAKKVIPARVEYYADIVGVTYGRIAIRHQKTRWGSCSRKGNLNFNCLLMLTPPEVLDSVVVHELCHRKEMNHSEKFYREVYRAFPDYDKWHGWLKKHGSVIMAKADIYG